MSHSKLSVRCSHRNVFVRPAAVCSAKQSHLVSSTAQYFCARRHSRRVSSNPHWSSGAKHVFVFVRFSLEHQRLLTFNEFMWPKIYMPYFARVRDTFSRCRFATKPMLTAVDASAICVARTHDRTITSFCRPWKASTEKAKIVTERWRPIVMFTDQPTCSHFNFVLMEIVLA